MNAFSSGASAPNPPETAKVESVELPAFEAQYSSHPIARFRIGRFQFEKNVLVLRTPEDVDAFETLVESADVRTRSLVKRIDPDAANKLAQSFFESKRTRGIDSSTPGLSGGAPA